MADEIITSEAVSSSSELNSSSRIICRVCQKQFSQYTCPRCNTHYCSLPCYKSHSLRCTESFMRENVMEELQHLQPDDGSKQKMLDILKRFHSEDEADIMDEDDSPLSEETIQKVLSGNQISFEDLSAEEKKHFQRAVASGELSKLIKPWEPWWSKPSAKYISLGQDGTQLVQSLVKEDTAVSSEDGIESDPLHDVPLGPDSPLPSVSKLSAAGPSPLLAVHLVDIMYSYCFTLRLYNGDWQSDPIGSATVLLSVSSVLGQGGQPETVLEALSHCMEQTCSPAFRHMGGLQFALGLINDTITLLHLDTPALVCMLCDLRRLIQHAEKDLKSENSRKSKSSEIKTKLKFAERKVYFIMCWAHEQPQEAWSSIAAMVEAEKSRLVEFIGSKTSVPKMKKVQNEGKPLIKEVE
ncbi:zinc finger HIT domain-containing protein 2 [Solanum tuberosum]|nr:PREDICTED: zinc finger HIT domain-containing protein 2 [Solanum tuberosum]